MKTGFIGYGNMGGALLRGLLDAGALDQSQVVVATRTPGRLAALVDKYPGIETSSNVELAGKCSRIFVGVKTAEVKGVIEEISGHVARDMHLISLCAGLEIHNLEKVYPGRITRVIPSMTVAAGAGVSLVCHNTLVGDGDREYIEGILGTVGKVRVVREDQFEVGADLTSCAPAFIACILREFAKAGVRHGDFSNGDALDMVLATAHGTVKLLCEKNFGCGEIMRMVATRGGISEEGLKVLERGLPPVFDGLFGATLGKHEITKRNITDQYDQRK